MPTYAADLDLACALARRAAAHVRQCWGRVERQVKSHQATSNEAVTEADRSTQRLIVAALRHERPGDGIIGEETDDGRDITNLAGGDRCWVIDPIDGTNNFVAGMGNVAVCIGLLEHGVPVAGVVHDVARDQCHAGARGLGAWLDGRRTRVVDTPLSDRSLVMLTNNLLVQGRLPRWPVRWLERAPWKLRMLGSSALETVQVSSGAAHAAITMNGKLWDVAAAAAVALEAGALLTALDGARVFPIDCAGYAGAKVPFVCAGAAAHAQLLAEFAAND
jgi:myo-inositol-1(or 4)-monophosphatase